MIIKITGQALSNLMELDPLHVGSDGPVGGGVIFGSGGEHGDVAVLVMRIGPVVFAPGPGLGVSNG